MATMALWCVTEYERLWQHCLDVVEPNERHPLNDPLHRTAINPYGFVDFDLLTVEGRPSCFNNVL